MRKISLLILLVFSTLIATAQMVNPVKWQQSVKDLNNGKYELLLTANIEKDWHLYSQYQNGMGMPLVITLDSGNYTAETSDKFWAETPKYTEYYDEMFKVTEFYLSNKAEFSYIIKRTSNHALNINAKIEGQACIDGKCVQVKDNLTFNILAIESAASVKNVELRESQDIAKQEPINEQTIDNNIVASPDLQPMVNADGLFQAANETQADKQVVDSVQSQNPATAVSENIETTEEESLLWFFILAFVGGLLGILTPCVFPMIPMTVSYFMKNGGKKQALFYGFSIVFMYVLFGVVLSAIFGQGFANFISTHWLPNVLFAIIFVVFAISLFGFFEITLPSSWVNKSANSESKAGYIGTFFMALTLVLVSFSCTLPIAGAVALGAADGSFLKPIIGMFGFSLAFALPFTFFAFFPNLLKKMPKSGGWMNTLKVSLAFIELAFALKFLSVPDQTYHWGILDREVYLAIWIVLFAMLGFYLLGKLRFPRDDEMPKQKSAFSLFIAIASLSFAVYMLPGMFGAPLNSLSGWLPPMKTQDFVIGQISTTASQDLTYENCSEPIFKNELKGIKGLKSYFDYDQAIECAKSQNKPLFLDFTGHGCVNCRQVEQEVLSNPRIQKILNENFIVCAMYVDDKVLELPEQYWLKSAEGDIIQSLGDKNAYIQTEYYQHNSQPCYIVTDINGKQLGEPIFYETNVDVFEAYLLKQLNVFN